VHPSHQLARPAEVSHWGGSSRTVCRPEYPWDLPESVRTGGGDPLYLDRAQLHHDPCQRDVQRYE